MRIKTLPNFWYWPCHCVYHILSPQFQRITTTYVILQTFWTLLLRDVLFMYILGNNKSNGKLRKKTRYHLTWKGISHLIRGLLFWEQHKIIRFDIKLGRLAQKSNSNVFQYFRFEKTFLTFLGFGSICQLYVVVGHMMENIKWLADNRIETDTFCLTKRWRIFKQKQIAHFIGLTFLHKTHSLRSLNNLFLMKFVFLKYSGSEFIVFS